MEWFNIKYFAYERRTIASATLTSITYYNVVVYCNPK